MGKNKKIKKRLARWYFNRWARNYDDSILHLFVFNAARRMLFKEVLRGKDNKNKKILDVGCGTGRLVHQLADYLKEARIHGVDISKSMIEKAKLKKRNKNVRFDVGDVERLPYEDNSFDIITCSHSFHHYPDKERAASEMYRVLRPGGRVMVIDGCRDVLLGKVIFKIVEKVERDVYHLLSREFRELFRKSGFNNIVQKRFNFVPLLLTIGTALK
jgi:ubiquinone/menaquinone biosynthesis C-methylase UbiE